MAEGAAPPERLTETMMRVAAALRDAEQLGVAEKPGGEVVGGEQVRAAQESRHGG
jgi:hypothetical protein